MDEKKTMTLSKIEKCAKLIGYEGSMFRTGGGFLIEGKTVETGGIFNPLTNKADLLDLMCAVGIDLQWHDDAVLVVCTIKRVCEWGYFDDHPDKQTALANAVVDVAEQIYDRKFGGELVEAILKYDKTMNEAIRNRSEITLENEEYALRELNALLTKSREAIK